MKVQKQCLPRQANNNWWKWLGRQIRRPGILRSVLAFVLFSVASARATIYVTGDNGSTNLFGTVDLASGQFSQIATTDPLFYALTSGAGGKIFGADLNSGHLFTISKSGATTQFGSSTAPDAFQGLAHSRSTGNFLAANVGQTTVTLYSIADDGNSHSLIGEMVGANSPGLFPTGNLVFGPGGKLYFDYFSADSTSAALYTVNTSTGSLTAVGNGLGTDILTLFSDGNTLYGIDTDFTPNDAPLGIYTINTTTGLATQVSTLTGLPGDYFLDAATVSTPDMGSTFGLLSLALTVLLGATRFRQWVRVTG
jgi:hypothetical protein